MEQEDVTCRPGSATYQWCAFGQVARSQGHTWLTCTVEVTISLIFLTILLEWQIKRCYVHVSKMPWVYANNRCDYLLKVALPTAFHTMSAPVSPPDTTALPSSHLYPCAPGLGVHFLPLLVIPWAQVPSLAHSRSITVC